MEINTNSNSLKLKGLFQLITAILLILVFMIYIGPWIEQLPYFHPIARLIEENDIDANMYFYTEVEEFSEASIHLQNSMDFIIKNRNRQNINTE